MFRRQRQMILSSCWGSSKRGESGEDLGGDKRQERGGTKKNAWFDLTQLFRHAQT
jgi:hypothetical protein